jgi:hypothetical protein
MILTVQVPIIILVTMEFFQSLFRVLKDKGLQKAYVHGEEEAPASSHRTSPQFKVTVFPL